MRIAHISDLHFGTFTMSPLQFFSKRWVGNFNFLLTRKKRFSYDRLIELVTLFKEKGITHVIITGDISVTSRRSEFQMGKRFVELLKKEGFKVFIIPGNHDHYTRRGYRKRHFYKFFESQFDDVCPYNLKEDKVTYTQIAENLWILAIDTAVPTSLVSSEGLFSKELEENLKKALQEIPEDDKIILINHFPFFQSEAIKKQLERGPILKEIVSKYPNILLYLHGHTHRQIVADLRQNDLPIISDSGSTSHIDRGACHLFELQDKQIKLDVYRYDKEWQPKESHVFHE